MNKHKAISTARYLLLDVRVFAVSFPTVDFICYRLIDTTFSHDRICNAATTNIVDWKPMNAICFGLDHDGDDNNGNNNIIYSAIWSSEYTR